MCLVVQWLTAFPMQAACVQSLVREIGILPAATKTQCSQVNYIRKQIPKKKRMYTELSMSTGCPDEKKRRLVIMAMRGQGRNQLDLSGLGCWWNVGVMEREEIKRKLQRIKNRNVEKSFKKWKAQTDKHRKLWGKDNGFTWDLLSLDCYWNIWKVWYSRSQSQKFGRHLCEGQNLLLPGTWVAG